MYTILGVACVIVLLVLIFLGPKLYYKVIEEINVNIIRDGIVLLENAFEDVEYPEPIECMLSRLDMLANGEIQVVVHLGDQVGQFVPKEEEDLKGEVFLIRKNHTLFYQLDEKMFPVWLAGEMANSFASSAGRVEKDTVEEYQSLLYYGEVLILVYERLCEIGYDFGNHPNVEELEEELYHYKLDRSSWLTRSTANLVAKHPQLAPAIAEALS